MTLAENEQLLESEKPHLDFSQQFKYAVEYLKVEDKILSILTKVSDQSLKKQSKIGALIVLGVFDPSSDSKVEGMRQMGINSVKKYFSFSEESFHSEITDLILKNSDGAIIANRNGQMLATKVYLEVEKPSLEVPEGCGTRHITAASFSTRSDVIAIFTLSEETSVVRTWKEGVVVEQYDPNENTGLKNA